MSTTILCAGCTLGYGTDPTYNTIEELNSVTVPTLTVASVDMTDLASLNRIFKPGTPDFGSLAFSINYTTAQYHDLRNLARQRVERDWKFTIPDSGLSRWKFRGSITGLSGAIPSGDGKISCEVSIKVNGVMTHGRS